VGEPIELLARLGDVEREGAPECGAPTRPRELDGEVDPVDLELRGGDDAGSDRG